MATKSMLKNVVLRDRKLANRFLTALDRAKTKRSKKVILERNIEEIKGEDVKRLFDGLREENGRE